MYTSAQSVSLGGTSFEPQDNDDIDSQESSIFDQSDTSKADEDIDDEIEGAFIENMDSIGHGLSSGLSHMNFQEDSAGDMEVNRAELGPSDQVCSPAKVTRMASIQLGLLTETSSNNCKAIKEMIQR